MGLQPLCNINVKYFQLFSNILSKWKARSDYFFAILQAYMAIKMPACSSKQEKDNMHIKLDQMSGKFMQSMNTLDNWKSRFAFH